MEKFRQARTFVEIKASYLLNYVFRSVLRELQDARFQTHAHLSLIEMQSILKDHDDCCQIEKVIRMTHIQLLHAR